MTRPAHETLRVEIRDASAVGHARRLAMALAERLGVDEVRCGEIGIIVTEASTNLLQHAKGGELLLHPLAHGNGGVEVVAIDRGPGMNLARCLEDGYSTGGSRGAGLGSIRRLADAFDVHSDANGTVLFAQRCARSYTRTPSPSRHGALCVSHHDEDVSGDAWIVESRGERTRVLVVDGLGHGAPAAEAAFAALRAFERVGWDDSVASTLAVVHRALLRTRGAAGAIAEIDASERRVRFTGVGNVAAAVHVDGHSKNLPSHNGILGHLEPRFQEFEHPWPESAVLVVQSDGLSSRWRLESYPGLEARSPTLIAGVLYRDFVRTRDDATVVVVRDRAPEPDA